LNKGSFKLFDNEVALNLVMLSKAKYLEFIET